jgi:hypothetical protein
LKGHLGEDQYPVSSINRGSEKEDEEKEQED